MQADAASLSNAAGPIVSHRSHRFCALLKEAGSDKTKLLSATIWLADMRGFEEMNAVWDAWLPEGGAPARATVEAKLATPAFTVEIGIIAAR